MTVWQNWGMGRALSPSKVYLIPKLAVAPSAWRGHRCTGASVIAANNGCLQSQRQRASTTMDG